MPCLGLKANIFVLGLDLKLKFLALQPEALALIATQGSLNANQPVVGLGFAVTRDARQNISLSNI